MTNQNCSPSVRTLFVLAVTLLLGSGYLHSASGQVFIWERDVTRPDRSPNPKINRLPNRRANKKQQEIEQAIKLGNQARDVSDYQQAFYYYQQAQKLNPQDARSYYGLGNLYLDLTCNDSAIEAYRKAIELDKHYLEARIGLGYTYSEEARYDHAQEQFQEALEQAPLNVEAVSGMGLLYAVKGRRQEAIDRIKHIIDAQLAKDKAAAHLALGDLHLKGQLDIQGAITQYQKAVSVKPDFAKAYFKLGIAQLLPATDVFADMDLVGDAKEQEKQQEAARQAASSLKRAIEYGHATPVTHMALACALALQFRYQEAIKETNLYFGKVKRLESQLASLKAPKCDSGFNLLKAGGHFGLGWTAFVEGTFESDLKRQAELYEEAAKQFDEAIKLRHDYAAFHSFLGLVYVFQGKVEPAIEEFNKAIRYESLEPNKATTYQILGAIYAGLGRNTLAIENAQEAIKRAPDKPLPYSTLAKIYLKQGKYDEAIVQQKKAIELESEPGIRSYHTLGVIYGLRFKLKRREDDFNEAVRWMKKAIEVKQNYADAYFELGITYRENFRADDALFNFQKAADYSPKDARIYFEMARVYSELKRNHDAAIKMLERAIELKPDYAEAVSYLAFTYDLKGDRAEAIRRLLKLTESTPTFLTTYYNLAYIYKSEKNYPEAIKHLKTAAGLTPTYFYPYKELAKIYEEQQKNEEAIHYYEEAIARLSADDSSTKDLYLGRIARLRGQYAEAMGYFQKLDFPEGPALMHYDMGLTYIATKNKQAALEQHQQLVRLKSPLAEELLKKIQEMK